MTDERILVPSGPLLTHPFRRHTWTETISDKGEHIEAALKEGELHKSAMQAELEATATSESTAVAQEECASSTCCMRIMDRDSQR